MPLVLMLALTYPIMAGQFAVAKFSLLAGLTLWDVVALRYGAAALVMLPFLARPDLRADLAAAPGRAVIVGLVYGGLYGVVLTFAIGLAPSIHGAVLMPSAAVLSTLPLSGFFLGLWPERRRLIGAAIVTAGLVTFGLGGGLRFSGGSIGGDLLFILMGFAWATLGVLVRRWSLSPLAVITAMALSGLVTTPVILALAPSGLTAAGWWHAGLQALYQGLLLTCLSFGLYAVIVTRLGASNAALGIATVPPMGLLFGWWLFGEMPNGWQALGVAAVIAGLVLSSGWRPFARRRLP